MKPRAPINTPRKVTQAREHLGLSKVALARVLRLAGHGDRTIARIEAGEGTLGVPGPVQLALEAMMAGFRPHDWKEGQ